MIVLVTGGAGFIGSHLCDRLLAAQHRVIAVDNFLTGEVSNLRDARLSERFSFIEADVSRPWAFLEKLESAPHLVLHFASPASPIDYARKPIETLRVNSVGTELACEAALKAKARLLFASTSECYGDPLEHPQRETYWGNVNPNGPRSCYDEAKRYGEAMVMAMSRSRGLDARIVRIFNTYGPRMRRNDGRVVPNFINQALMNSPLTIYGDGSQTRSFCYVDDLVEGILACAASERTRDIVVNLGNPTEHTIAEFAAIVAEVAEVSLVFKNEMLPVDDPTRRCPDITRARQLLSWEPRVNLRDGLLRTFSAFRTSMHSAPEQRESI